MNRFITLCSLLLPAGMAAAQTPVAPGAPYAPGYATINSVAPANNVVVPSATPTCVNCSDSKSTFGSKFIGLFSRKTTGECSSCAGNGGISGLHGTTFGSSHAGKAKHAPPPVADGGTLVFPNHSFIRSPRDWFQE